MITTLLLSARLFRIGLLCSWCALSSAQTDTFTLRNDDRVVFYGDSITAQHLYTRFTEEFAITRYPEMRVQFVNAGVPGDTVSGGYAGTRSERIARDVAPVHPTMITVMLGMNDGGWGYTPQVEMLADFQEGMHSLLEEMRRSSPQTKFTLVNPTPYDEVTHGTEFPGYNRAIKKLSQSLSRMAADSQPLRTFVADFNTPMQSALACAHERFPQLAPLLIPDRIHPAEVAHWIMAEELMKAWRVTPVVAAATINVPTAQTSAVNRTSISQIRKANAGIEWTEQDEALPLPIDLNNAMTPVVLACSDIASLDQEILQVIGLERGRYELWIDGKIVNSFSASELASGVNLALQKTPMLAQARGVDWLEERRTILDEAELVLKADVKQTTANAPAHERLSEVQKELEMAIREKAKPTPHHFEIKRQQSASPSHGH